MSIATLVTGGVGSFSDVAHLVRDGLDASTVARATILTEAFGSSSSRSAFFVTEGFGPAALVTAPATILTQALGTTTARSAYLVTEGFGTPGVGMDTGTTTLPQVTVAGAGTLIVDDVGVVAEVTLPTLTAAGLGTVGSDHGTVAFPQIIATGLGTVSVAGTATVALPQVTVAGSGVVGGIFTPTISVTLTDVNNAIIPNLLGLYVAWWDDPLIVDGTAATLTWSGQSTNSNGVLSVTSVPGSALAAGEVGWIEVTDSDGTVTQSPVAKVAAGPIQVS